MDYKKKYNEALERAKKLYGQGTITESLGYVFPELKESEDEKIKSDIISYLQNEKKVKRYISDIEFDKWIAWLEKQSEKKSQGKSALEAIKEEKIDNANKVEPKFHPGDWITTTDEEGNVTTEKIIEFWGDKVRLIDIDGFYTLWPKHELNYYRLWTIQDANDGDVLCYETKSELRIFIYKNGCVHHHCCYYNGHLTTIDSFFVIQKHLLSYIHLATKEQRDLLFQKMKEAGYEWDADKKELKKLSNGDEEIRKAIIHILKGEINYTSKEDTDKYIAWLKSLKQRIGE